MWNDLADQLSDLDLDLLEMTDEELDAFATAEARGEVATTRSASVTPYRVPRKSPRRSAADYAAQKPVAA